MEDGSGDHLDAWLCAVQAASGYADHLVNPASNYGMGDIDALEGWIVGVPKLASNVN